MATIQADEYRDEESQNKTTKKGYGSVYFPPGDSVPRNRYSERTTESAAFVNGELSRWGISSWGHAYQIPSQGEVVFGGYDNLAKPQIIDKSNVLDYQYRAADRIKASDFDKLDPNKLYITSMYYRDSDKVVDHYNAAQKEKRKNNASNTHVGILYHDGKDWKVTHSINDTIYNSPVNTLLGGNHRYGITGVYTAPESNTWKTMIDYFFLKPWRGKWKKEIKNTLPSSVRSKGSQFINWYKGNFMRDGGTIHDGPASVNPGGEQRNYGITGVYTTAEPLKQKSARDGINSTIESTQGSGNHTVKSIKGKVNHPIKSKDTKLLRQFKKYFMQSGGMIPICGQGE